MSSPVITVENLGKDYVLTHQGEGESYRTLRDTLSGWFRHSKSKIENRKSEIFHALHDVSFEVQQGEVLGIIGRNGAGKSTLLKILSRITEPTRGQVRLRGRVASLLEVGTGFHPELTGRENIFLNGAILGMTRMEIRKKFDEIVDFSGVERFLDTPVKRYSSGMYVRLAFAVAAHLEPEILIIDEVLAVGDAAFQKKCLGKMESVAQTEGRTVLYVSHQMPSILNLCHSVVCLHQGRIASRGPTADVVEFYLRELCSPSAALPSGRSGIAAVEIDPGDAARGDITIHIRFKHSTDFKPIPGLVFKDALGRPVFGTNNRHDPHIPLCSSGLATFRIPQAPLRSGTYSVTVFLGDEHGDFDLVQEAAYFAFTSGDPEHGLPPLEVIGSVKMPGVWTIQPGPPEAAPLSS
jgi:lipopolysaccharide transport system ATP-binding protein